MGLSAQQRAEFFEAIVPGLFIHTEAEFIEWTRTGLQKIFPHGMMACGIGILAGDDIDVKHVICCNFPQEYVESLQQPNGLTNSPLLQQWLREQRPILFEPADRAPCCSEEPAWLEKFHRYGLVNVAAHGQCDLDNESASYFSFSCVPGRLSKRHALLLQLLIPHLHNTLVRITPNLFANETHDDITLTGREGEILKWMSCGKSNNEIAQVLNLSVSTVKKHVRRILAKLNVTSRTQAVAKALKQKLIGSE